MIRSIRSAIIVALLSGCCSSTIQPQCDPMPKYKGYVLELKP